MKKQNTSDRLKYLMDKKGYRQIDIYNLVKPLCDKYEIKMHKSNISQYVNGLIEPSQEKLQVLSEALHVSPAWLMGYDVLDSYNEKPDIKNIQPITTIKLPMLGEVACGEPILCNEDRESYVEVGSDIKADFCLRAKGDSMINARICDGDIIFVRQQSMVDNGDIAVVIINDEATLKRVSYDSSIDELRLMAENPNYKTMIFHGEELNQIRILGKAIAFQGDVK